MNGQPTEKPLAGRIAVVTGANRGLGFETARQLRLLGADVVLTGRNPDRLERAQAEMQEAAFLTDRSHDSESGGAAVYIHALDVTDSGAVSALFDWIDNRFSRLDILVNNAGELSGGYTADLSNTPAELIAQTIDTNALGAWRMMRRAIPMMNENTFGRVVNVSSGMGALSDMGSGAVPYRVSKTALNVLTRLAAHEAGENVLVNAVCPGWVRTDMGGASATRDVSEGARSIVWGTTLDSDGPNGGFFRDGKPIAW